MNRARFLRSLERALRAYPRDSVQKTLDYYDEMISEEQAVNALGSIEDIVHSLPQAETPVPAGRRRRGWNTALIVLGFPLWLPLLIAFFALLLSGLIVLLAAIVCLFALELALAAAAYSETTCVDFETVWGQGHTEAERSGSATANFISWVHACMK